MTTTTFRRGAGAVLAGALAASTLWAAPAQAREPIDVRPTQLTRTTSTEPHVEGNVFVQGDVRTKVGADHAWYVGQSRNGHVLMSGNKVVRITSTGSRHVIAKRVGWAFLAPDGETLWTQQWGKKVYVQQHDALTGWDGKKYRVSDRTTLLGGRSSAIVLTDGRRTTVVRWGGDGQKPRKPRTLIRKHVYNVDLANNRMAYFTRDPYEGGCSVVVKINAPKQKLWRSCKERVDTFSPGGTRMVTVHILSDGIGPNLLTLRTRKGARLADYTTATRGWIGQPMWGSGKDSSMTFDVHGPRWSTVARCSGTDCTRISKLTPTEPEA